MLTLKDICVVDWGNTSLTKKSYEQNGAYLAVSATGADGKISHYEHEADVCVLSAIGAQCGKMFFPQQRFTAIKNTITLTPNRDLVDSKYLYYLFSHIELPKRGAAQPFISKGDIEKFELPYLPPIAEQQRIVAKLDAVFAEIDRAIDVVGEQIQENHKLFASTVEAMFKKKSGWVKKTLQEICEKITDGTHQTPTYFEDGYIFLSSKNVTTRKVDWDNIKYIDEEQHKAMQKRLSPKVGDILLAKNGTTGVAAMVDRDVEFDIYVSLALLRSKGEVIPDYMLQFINSNAARAQFAKRTKGIGVPNLHLKEIREVEISFPVDTLEQQKVTNVIDKIDALYQRRDFFLCEKKANLYQLKSAILAQVLNQSEAV